MKKIFGLAVAALGLITLASCNQQTVDYTLNAEGVTTKEVSKNWLNNVFNITVNNNQASTQDLHAVALNEKKTDAECYVVYLPEDVKDNLCINYYNLDSNTDGESVLHDKTYSIKFSGLMTYALTETEKANILNVISTTEAEYTFDLEGAKFQTNWSVDILASSSDYLESKEGSYRYSYAIYAPLYVEHYLMQDSNSVCVLQTYVLLPVYYGVAYQDASTQVFDDSLASLIAKYPNKGLKAITDVSGNIILK